jgi:hypothetical protein
MLHMLVNTHNPESCAFRGQDEARILSDAFDRLDEGAARQGAVVKASWVNRAAHEIFVLVDAPNAHVIEEALLAAGLVGRTHSRVLSVVAAEDVEFDTGDEHPR